jgi:hypothetical protein
MAEQAPGAMLPNLALALDLGVKVRASGQHCHPTLSFYTAIDCHSLGIHILILLSLLSFQSK